MFTEKLQDLSESHDALKNQEKFDYQQLKESIDEVRTANEKIKKELTEKLNMQRGES